MFADREAAGRRLAAALKGSVDEGTLVLGVPRGGVVVAAEVARELGLPLDVVVVRKIGAPGNPEYAIGAVDEQGTIIGAQSWAADAAYLERAAREGRQEIERRLRAYRGDSAPVEVAGRTVVVVDDGIATGLTLLAAIESLRRRGAARIVVAAPVSSTDAAQRIAAGADELVVLETPASFYAVGQFYSRFNQTEDAEVIALLEEARSQSPHRADR